ncbi:importin-4-like isoform X2 [Actinia tenebrosa]|nr:importin-4-like isoform X2 [Actinia tenebrosa]
MGMFVLSSVTETVGEQLKPQFPVLLTLFSSTLEDQGSKMVPFYTIRALMSMIESIGTDEVSYIRPLIPKVMTVVEALLEVDEDKACEAMEIFDELVESEVSIVTPHLVPLMEFCLKLAMNTKYTYNSRIKALSFISWLARIKPKSLIKNKLIMPTLAVVFPIMAAAPSEEELEEMDEELEDGAEASRPCAVASQVLDNLALHLPPETLIPPLMEFIQPAVGSANPYERKAALIALAVLAEGCADYLKNRYLEAALETVCRGLSDSQHIVQNAALFALGQFSEHLQPDISAYSEKILPILFEHLGRSTMNNKDQCPSATRTYYALETFCENLGEGILPYLPALLEKLLTVLSTSQNTHLKELAISGIGATASAAKENLVPYFPQIVELIKVYLTSTADGNLLQVQTIDTLGVLARTIGAQNFLPLAEECIQLGLNLLAQDRDPDLRRCTYGLFASISTILKTDMEKFLPDIMKHMVDSLQSTEGIVTHYAEEDDPSFLLEDEEVEDEELEDDEDITGYSVENSYLEEKEDTCNALGELAENTGIKFLPYLDEVSKEVLRLVQFPHTGVRKGAVTALGQFCVVFHKVLEESQTQDRTPLQRLVATTVNLYITVITKDKDRTVVMATLQALNEMLTNMKGAALVGEGHVDSIVAAVRAIFLQQTGCQEDEDESYDGDDDQQAEFDAMLIEYSGDCLPALANAIGGQAFAPYFAGFMPLLLKKIRKSLPTSDKSFAIGTISEVVLALGPATIPFVQHLYPVFVGALKDPDDEVRSNATYGLGLLVMNGGDVMVPYYQVLLEAFFSMSSSEQPGRVVDNVCGAVSRMIMAKRSAVPLDKVFPMIIQCLPLKEDFEENPTVYSCIIELFSDQHPQVMQHLGHILGIFAQVLPSPDLQEDVRAGLVNMTKSVRQQYPQDFETLLHSLPQDRAQILLTATQAPS